MPGTKKLVIVESPAKAKTIAQYLGDGYIVQASVGHIRDLIEPKNLPPELKKGSLGIELPPVSCTVLHSIATGRVRTRS